MKNPFKRRKPSKLDHDPHVVWIYYDDDGIIIRDQEGKRITKEVK